MLRLKLIAASNRQPDWVDRGTEEYAKRLRGRCTLEIKIVPLARRTAGTPVERALRDEGERILAAVPEGAHVVALLETGKPWSTEQLAAKLEGWMQGGAPVAFLVGGPDGLSPDCVSRAGERWSLSNLTLPHGLVRIVVAEAVYRAWSLLENHPYHRAWAPGRGLPLAPAPGGGRPARRPQDGSRSSPSRRSTAPARRAAAQSRGERRAHASECETALARGM